VILGTKFLAPVASPLLLASVATVPFGFLYGKTHEILKSDVENTIRMRLADLIPESVITEIIRR